MLSSSRRGTFIQNNGALILRRGIKRKLPELVRIRDGVPVGKLRAFAFKIDTSCVTYKKRDTITGDAPGEGAGAVITKITGFTLRKDRDIIDGARRVRPIDRRRPLSESRERDVLVLYSCRR
jgi:hypothetical protein